MKHNTKEQSPQSVGKRKAEFDTKKNLYLVGHTPGEWVAQNWLSHGENDDSYPEEIRASGWPHGKLVAKIAFNKKDSFGNPVIYQPGELKANARLIVSAVNNTAGKGINPEAVPDLLEALKRCKDWFYLNAKSLKIPLDGVGAPACFEEIISAINKATKQ